MRGRFQKVRACLVAASISGMLCGCDPQDAPSPTIKSLSRQPDTGRGAYALTGASPHSALWNCRARILESGGPASDRQLDGFREAIAAPPARNDPADEHRAIVEPLGAFWSVEPAATPKSSDYASTSLSIHAIVQGGANRTIGLPLPEAARVGEIFKGTAGRIYPLDTAETIDSLKKEFGRPSAIIVTSGEGCRMGPVTMIYSAEAKDGDGGSIQVGEMCQAPPLACSLETIDPCSRRERLPTSRYAFVNVSKNVTPVTAARVLPDVAFKPGAFSAVRLTFFDTAVAARGGFPLTNPRRTLKACASHDPYSH